MKSSALSSHHINFHHIEPGVLKLGSFFTALGWETWVLAMWRIFTKTRIFLGFVIYVQKRPWRGSSTFAQGLDYSLCRISLKQFSGMWGAEIVAVGVCLLGKFGNTCIKLSLLWLMNRFSSKNIYLQFEIVGYSHVPVSMKCFFFIVLIKILFFHFVHLVLNIRSSSIVLHLQTSGQVPTCDSP